jgi:ferredoxin
VLTEPLLFDQREDDGTVVVLDDQPTGGLVEQARTAVRVCPSQALSLQE